MGKILALLLMASATEAIAQPSNHVGHADMAAPKAAMILDGYGTGGFPITTKVSRAQAFFDNGMQLSHAFAHQAGIDAMKEAVRLDPACAMCLWGEAWASGPTINFGKGSEEVERLSALADEAAALALTAGTDRERAMTHALQLRYHDGGGGKPGDLAFAKAMTVLAGRYPGDKEIAVIAADAWLQVHSDGHDDDVLNAQMAMMLVEPVLRVDPDFTPAIHFYIHTSELAGVPALAEPYADRLAALAPKASHLVHMPSHTYYWVGRYQDAADRNMQAVRIGLAQAKAMGLPQPDGVWGLPYHVHNVTFGLGGALEAGDAETALALGRPLIERSQAAAKAGPFQQMIAAAGYYAMLRFAPQEMMELPEPKLPYLKAAWHYARGEVFAARKDLAGVRREAEAIRAVTSRPTQEDGSAFAEHQTAIERDVLGGRAAMLEGRASDAALLFRAAAEEQESAEFSAIADPPAFYYPVRRDLAEALLAADDREGARREAQGALAYRPRDPATTVFLASLDARSAAR